MVWVNLGEVEAKWSVGFERRLVGASLIVPSLAGVGFFADRREGICGPKSLAWAEV